MNRQAFQMPDKGLAANAIVEITSCEDRGDFYYVSYIPVIWLDGKRINQKAGQFGSARIAKDGPKPKRLNIVVQDAPHYGIGVRAAFSLKS